MPRFATTKPKFSLSSKNATPPKPVTPKKPTAKIVAAKKTTSKSSTKPSTIYPNSDNISELNIPNDVIYGIKTARALINFNIGEEKMPRPVIKAIGILKKSATLANEELNLLTKDKALKIAKATDEIIDGTLDKHFPLTIWQTGSGMHSNMNANEVIANRAIELAGGRQTKSPIHPINDINKSQSNNDAFSTAMHIAAAMELKNTLIPAAKRLRNTFSNKAKEFETILKIGRTHSMDAFIMTLGQEFDYYANQLNDNIDRLEETLVGLYQLPLGGIVVGTDRININMQQKFSVRTAKQISKLTRLPFVLAPNKLTAISSQCSILTSHNAIKTLATSLFKIANDIRLLASGPRCGLGELILPEVDPIDPILSGKNNPIHCEALTMVCLQIFGNDTTITMASASGQFELNAYKPVIIYNFLQSIRLLSDASNAFEKYCIRGVKVNRTTMQRNIDNNLVLISNIVDSIGYDNAVKVIKLAYKEDLRISDVIEKLNIMSVDEYERMVKPEKLLSRKR